MMLKTNVPGRPVLTKLTVGRGQTVTASLANSFRITAIAERLSKQLAAANNERNITELFCLCLSLARGIDHAVAYNEVPVNKMMLNRVLKQISEHKYESFLQAAVTVLMISFKHACVLGWFSDHSEGLLTLVNEVERSYSCEGASNGSGESFSIVTNAVSRFYPFMIMGNIICSLEIKPGYGTYMTNFHISKSRLVERIFMLVVRTDQIETSACIISPTKANFLLNGKGVEQRSNVSMDAGPQLPSDVTGMLKFGANLVQVIGQFDGHYVVIVAHMSPTPLPETPILQNYTQSEILVDPDSDIIEGPSRIVLNCPISRSRIKIPVKGKSCKHLQCFDFRNFIDINCRRPSWRCPFCNQSCCYPDIRVDQNLAKILQEVGDHATSVILSADGSWKGVHENDETPDQSHGCAEAQPVQDDTFAAASAPMVVDLTDVDEIMDFLPFTETEDLKPGLTTSFLQPHFSSLPASSHLSNADDVIQYVSGQSGKEFWSNLLSASRSLPSSSGASASHNIAAVFAPNNELPSLSSTAVNSVASHDESQHNFLYQAHISDSTRVSVAYGPSPQPAIRMPNSRIHPSSIPKSTSSLLPNGRQVHAENVTQSPDVGGASCLPPSNAFLVGVSNAGGSSNVFPGIANARPTQLPFETQFLAGGSHAGISSNSPAGIANSPSLPKAQHGGGKFLAGGSHAGISSNSPAGITNFPSLPKVQHGGGQFLAGGANAAVNLKVSTGVANAPPHLVSQTPYTMSGPHVRTHQLAELFQASGANAAGNLSVSTGVANAHPQLASQVPYSVSGPHGRNHQLAEIFLAGSASRKPAPDVNIPIRGVRWPFSQPPIPNPKTYASPSSTTPTLFRTPQVHSRIHPAGQSLSPVCAVVAGAPRMPSQSASSLRPPSIVQKLSPSPSFHSGQTMGGALPQQHNRTLAAIRDDGASARNFENLINSTYSTRPANQASGQPFVGSLFPALGDMAGVHVVESLVRTPASSQGQESRTNVVNPMSQPVHGGCTARQQPSINSLRPSAPPHLQSLLSRSGQLHQPPS